MPSFVARVEERCGLKIRVIDGAEEGRLSALGVLSAIPDADGLVADLGGGSCEVVLVGETRLVSRPIPGISTARSGRGRRCP